MSLTPNAFDPHRRRNLARLGMLFVACAAGQRAIAADDLFDSVEKWAKDNVDENVLNALNQIDRDRVQQGLAELEKRLHGNSVYDLGGLKKSAALILPLLQQSQATVPLAEWLQTRRRSRRAVGIRA